MCRDRIVMSVGALTNFGKERLEGSRVEKESACPFRQHTLLSSCVNAEGMRECGLATERAWNPGSRWTEILLELDCDF
jgi:hypothetical protein